MHRAAGKEVTARRKNDDPPRLVIIPDRRDIPVGTLRAVIRQSGLTIERFLDLLK